MFIKHSLLRGVRGDRNSMQPHKKLVLLQIPAVKTFFPQTKSAPISRSAFYQSKVKN